MLSKDIKINSIFSKSKEVKQNCYKSSGTKVNLRSKSTFPSKEELQAYTDLNQHDPEVLGLLVGILLTDGYSSRGYRKNRKGTENTSIGLKQSAEKLPFLEYVKNFLSHRNYCNILPLAVKGRLDSRTNKTYYHTEFKTYAMKSLNGLHSLFFRPATEEDKNLGRPNAIWKKVIPPNIADFLLPITLAMMWACDGSIHMYSGAGYLHLLDFAFEDLQRLQLALKQVFNIDCRIREKKTNHANTKAPSFRSQQPQVPQYLLYFPRTEMEKLAQIVLPFTVPSMYYKLGLKIDGTPTPIKKAKVNIFSLTPALRPQGSFFDLPVEAQPFLVGAIFAFARVRKHKKSSNIEWKLPLSSFEYAKILYEKLVEFGMATNKELKINNFKNRIIFGTLRYPNLDELHGFFYSEGKKKLPTNIENLLTPAALAVWCMEAGILKGNQFLLPTICTTDEQVFVLRSLFETKFGLCCSIEFLNSNFLKRWHFCFTEHEKGALFKIINPYLFENFNFSTDLRACPGRVRSKS